MPFAGFKNFDACVDAQKAKGLSDESARRVCGALMTRFEGKSDESKSLKHYGGTGCLNVAALTESEQKEYARIVTGLETLTDDEIDVKTDEDLVAILQKFATLDSDSTEEIEISEAFITDEDDTVHSAADILGGWARRTMKGFGEQRMVSEKDAMQADKDALDVAQRETAREVAVVAKTAVGTTQQQSELGQDKFTYDLSQLEIVEPPYPPELLATFLEVDEVHFRCVRTKVTDSVGRDYQIVPLVTVRPDEDTTHDDAGRPVAPKDSTIPVPVQPIGAADDIISDPTQAGRSGGVSSPGLADQSTFGPVGVGNANKINGHQPQQREGVLRSGFRSFLDVMKSAIGVKNDPTTRSGSQTDRKRLVSQKEVDDETQIIEDFIEDANDVLGFEGVLDRACMDYEGIGWAAIEVIRSADMKVRRIAHAPAVRMRVLKGWRGFVEIVSHDRADGSTVYGGKYIYYQSFGNKITSKRKHPITGQFLPFDASIDGKVSPKTARWNVIDRETGAPTDDLSLAANEIMWVPRHHTNTIYYGYTDVVPALGWLLANVHIRDYMLQFFEHNTVPRYAIIIEGAKLSDPVKKAISSYFSTHVKGKAHKTLIIPIPSMRGEVKIRFEKLDADAREGSFQETKKNNAQSIMTSHGVSPAIIGISESSELGSGKGLSQAEIYKDRIVTPSQRYWARQLNRMFKIGLGTSLVALKFNPLDIRDEKAEMEVQTGFLFKGCTTINAVRRKCGLGPPVAGGDRPFLVLGNTVMFVDEMTEAMGTEREDMMLEVESIKNDMAMQKAVGVANGKPNANGSKKSGATPNGANNRSSIGASVKPKTVGTSGGGDGGTAKGGTGTPAKAKSSPAKSPA